MATHKLTVIKRDGSEEPVRLQEIQDRIESLATGLDDLDSAQISLQVTTGLKDRMRTSELDEYAAQICSSHASHHYQYGILATRLVVSNLHKITKSKFSKVMHDLYWHYDSRHRHCPRISEDVYKMLKAPHPEYQDGPAYGAILDAMVDHSRDQLFNYFGLKTLTKAYLLKKNFKIVERPQHMYMRVAVQIHGTDIEKVRETYDLMSRHCVIHATPTLFNSCTPCGNMISCFLLGTSDDMGGLYSTVKDCALISKASGGIGVHMSNVRPRGSPIYGTGGTSDGVAPYCRVLNYTMLHANQGGGKRNGSLVATLEPWCGDTMEFLTLRLNTGDEDMKARNLFYALWIPNLLLERAIAGKDWSFFDSTQCPDLSDMYGPEFDRLYTQYEKAGLALGTIPAMKVLRAAFREQQHQGLPYMMLKDWVNAKSNLRHYKTIKSSNLCCEIVEPSDDKEYAVCCLASINFKSFPLRKSFLLQGKHWDEVWSIEDLETLYDFEELARQAGVLCRNLDNIIDKNSYPVSQTEIGAMLHRYIGIGGQGLQDLFFELGLPFWSEKARLLNRYISETVYYGAMKMSIQLAKERGTYPMFQDSPLSEGKFQYDLWAEAHPDYQQVPDTYPLRPMFSKWDWDVLRTDLLQHGARNALLVAYMPTQSTSRINGNTAGMEPQHTNMYKESTIGGTFPVINNYLMKDLMRLGLWSDAMRQKIMRHNGSIQEIPEIPEGIRDVYKTCFEIRQSGLLYLAADRGPFCCQSQSTNLFLTKCEENMQKNCLLLAYKLGLKTASYYTHSRAGTEASKLSLAAQKEACSILNKEACIMCEA